MMRLGIDVGGTHTDAVLMSTDGIVGRCKALTSADIHSGIVEAMSQALASANHRVADIGCVMIGTTQFTNAVIERRNLSPVLALRLSLPGGAAVPPMSGWPDDLKQAASGGYEFLHGGYEYNGREIHPLVNREIVSAISLLKERPNTNVAITSTFSPLKPDLEIELAERLKEQLPDIAITCSHELGGLGLLDRENAAILNAALTPLAGRVVHALEGAVRQAGVTAPVFISQNDGTLMSAAVAARYPVMTFSSGPTNSMRGAMYLSGVENGIVVDVGGTTSDVGMLIDGFPRPSGTEVYVGGVRTNFRMPDILPVGLGGGSIVRESGARLGPDSVGHRLVSEGLLFGGSVLTASDVGVAAGLADFGDRSRLGDLPDETVQAALAEMRRLLSDAIDQIKTSADELPLIAVGGGAFLIPDSLPGISAVLRPEDCEVANAVGAALAQAGGEAELLYSPSKMSRDDALSQVRQDAREKAINLGADPDSIRIISMEETRLAYMADDSVRLKARAVGDLSGVREAGP